MFTSLISALVTSLLLPSTLRHLHHIKRQSSSEYRVLTVGTDDPADPTTVGFTVGHFALLVNTLDVTRQFYGEIHGRRHIFTYDGSADYTIMFMGHAQGGKNSTGFSTGEEQFSGVYKMEGLMESLSLEVLSLVVASPQSRAFTRAP
jgi:lactoylglutathione lyase